MSGPSMSHSSTARPRAPEPTQHMREPLHSTQIPAPTPNTVRPKPKCYKVTVETVPDEDVLFKPSALGAPTAGPSSTRGNPPGTHPSNEGAGPEPRSSRRAQVQEQPARPHARPHARRGLRQWRGLYVEDFPDPLAGAPVSNERASAPDMEAYMQSCGRSANPKTFKMLELLMTTGLTDAAKDQHLKSSIYRERAPWPGCEAMLKDVDKLAHGPEFDIHDIEIFDGQRPRVQYMVSRNIVDLIRDVVGNRRFRRYFMYAPKRYYTSRRKTERMYAEANSANWWWREQEKMRGKGAVTIAPLILATDQTTLSVMCGGQTAYPVYVSLANISKQARHKPSKRAMVLLGYLPVEPFEDIANDDERRRMKADLVHRAMEKMLEPLKKASEDGVEMWCPDGRLRRIYLRIAAHLADWPEQNLHSCTTEGSCPVCSTKRLGRGSNMDPAPLRDREETLGAIRSYFITKDIRELQALSLKPVWPWWGDLPHVNLATCITPDLLHQLYQGVFKSHLVCWLKHFIGEDVLDQRFAAMPQVEGIKHFVKGISAVKQWTGRESKEMLAQILPAVLGDLTPDATQLVCSVIDFIFRAHASSMTDRDLAEMERDLEKFHELKELLVVHGFYQSEGRFDRIPKLHMLSHYVHSIRELGTPDGYNTEAPEHLHIEYAKVPWRASNKVRPLKQMLTYIQRQEAVRIHRAYLDEYLGLDQESEDKSGDGAEETQEVDREGGYDSECDQEATYDVADNEDDVDPEDDIKGGADDDVLGDEPGQESEATYPSPHRHMAANPTKRNVEIKDVIKTYQASDLTSAIGNFL
ncbi:hypothetical protein FRC06_010996, partial [Ceratobasidium sp. 370]